MALVDRRLVVVLVSATMSSLVALGAPPAHASAPSTFTFTGSQQVYVVPAGVTDVHIAAVGAPGGGDGAAAVGGHGGVAAGDVAVSPGESLYVEVGQPGFEADDLASNNAAFNGGGEGGITKMDFQNGGGGGGASDVRTISMASSGTLESRLVVAGGGGGGAGDSALIFEADPQNGGDAGSPGQPTDANSCALEDCGGGAGTQTSGGTAGAEGTGTAGTAGALGIGGNGGDYYPKGTSGFDPSGYTGSGGGGGGGWYGGGGGGDSISEVETSGTGGGGGSDGFAGTVVHTATAVDTSGTPTVTITPNAVLRVVSSGTGTVTSASGNISCPSGCAAVDPVGTVESLTAHPAAGSRFTGWTGACSGRNSCQLTMSEDQTVRATFTKIVPPPGTHITRTTIVSSKRKAAFRFSSHGARTSFQCALRPASHRHVSWRRCKSPKTYKKLARKKYVFEVRAVGPGGADKTPAKATFRIS